MRALRFYYSVILASFIALAAVLVFAASTRAEPELLKQECAAERVAERGLED